MKVRQLDVRDAYEFNSSVFPDARGSFNAPYFEPEFVEAVGHPLHVAQANVSVQAKRGVIRGVHFASVPPGQAKYLWVPRGAVLDLVIDIRVGSPTFGEWDAVRCDDVSGRAMYLAEGLGHAFVALEDDTVVSYLCSTGYDPVNEHTISPLDPAFGLPWPDDLEPILSDRDRDAPSLAETRAAGLLPEYDACLARYAELRAAA